MVEIFEYATSDDGLSFTDFQPFVSGDVRDLDRYVKFRVTVSGDFDVDDYRLRGFSGIADDATVVEGGFGLSPFGRFPFADGGVCFEDDTTDLLAGGLHLSGALRIIANPHPAGDLSLSGTLLAVIAESESGSLNLSGALDVEVFRDFDGQLAVSGVLAPKAEPQEAGSLSLSGTLEAEVGNFESGSLSLSGSLAAEVFRALDGQLSLSGSPAPLVKTQESGSLALSGTLQVEVKQSESGSLSLDGSPQVLVKAAESGSLSLDGSLATVVTNAFGVLGGFGPSQAVGNGATIYISPSTQFQGTNQTTEANVSIKIPIAISLANITAILSGALGAGTTLTFKYVVDGVVQSGIILTLTSGQQTGTATGTVSVSAGQTLSIQITSTGNVTQTVQSVNGQYVST